MGDWHSRSVSQVMEKVAGRPGGLTNREAAQEQSLPQELLDAFAMLSHQPPEGAPGKPEK